MTAPSSPGRSHRFILPLIVAVVAIGMIIWSRQQAAHKNAEVQRFVQQICADVTAGRDLRGVLNPDDSFSEQQTIEQLTQVCGDAGVASRVETIITDPASVEGNAGGGVTHAALLRLDGVDRLGLLVKHDGSAPIRVTGYWLPSP